MSENNERRSDKLSAGNAAILWATSRGNVLIWLVSHTSSQLQLLSCVSHPTTCCSNIYPSNAQRNVTQELLAMWWRISARHDVMHLSSSTLARLKEAICWKIKCLRRRSLSCLSQKGSKLRFLPVKIPSKCQKHVKLPQFPAVCLPPHFAAVPSTWDIKVLNMLEKFN